MMIKRSDHSKAEGHTNARLLYDRAPCSSDTAAKKADLFKRSLFIDSNNRHVGNNGILRECRCSHLMSKYENQIQTHEGELTKWWMGFPLIENRLELSVMRPLPCVARTSCILVDELRHDKIITFAAEIGLSALAEFTFATF